MHPTLLIFPCYADVLMMLIAVYLTETDVMLSTVNALNDTINMHRPTSVLHVRSARFKVMCHRMRDRSLLKLVKLKRQIVAASDKRWLAFQFFVDDLKRTSKPIIWCLSYRAYMSYCDYSSH